jgi:hypothetical protein
MVGSLLQHTPYAMVIGNDPTKLMEIWSRQVAEMLPSDEFKVEFFKGALRIKGIGARTGTGRISVFPSVLRLPMPSSQRLKLFFVDECNELQGFVTKVRGKPWPSPDASPHVQVDDETINIWWSGRDDERVVLEIQPLSREEIHM